MQAALWSQQVEEKGKKGSMSYDALRSSKEPNRLEFLYILSYSFHCEISLIILYIKYEQQNEFPVSSIKLRSKMMPTS